MDNKELCEVIADYEQAKRLLIEKTTKYRNEECNKVASDLKKYFNSVKSVSEESSVSLNTINKLLKGGTINKKSLDKIIVWIENKL